MTLSNKQNITDEQTNPADFDKTILEIAPPLPETTKNNAKLKEMDALVASYIAECNAEIEIKAKNSKNNVPKCANTFQNIPKRSRTF